MQYIDGTFIAAWIVAWMLIRWLLSPKRADRRADRRTRGGQGTAPETYRRQFVAMLRED